MHATSPGYAVWYDGNTNMNSDHNNLSATGANVGRLNSSTYTDLPAWQAATSGDANSISTNPVFMSNIDLHVSNVLLNSAGQAIAGVSVDFDGEDKGYPA